MSADYIITGAWSGEPGQYHLSLSASELSTSVVRWADDKDLRERVPPPPPPYKKIRTAGLIVGGVATGLGAGLIFLDLNYGLNSTGFRGFTTLGSIGVGLAIFGPVMILASLIFPPLMFPEAPAPVAGLSFGVSSNGMSISYSGKF